MNNNFDLEQFVDMFDTAMSSNNPTVKKCFNNLLMVVALAHAEDKEKHIGPLRSLVEKVDLLEKRLSDVEHSQYQQSVKGSYGPTGSAYITSISNTSTYPPTGFVNKLNTSLYSVPTNTNTNTNTYTII